MTDAVFYLKIPAYGDKLSGWPNDTRHIILEPPKGASVQGDWRTSTAYNQLAAQWSAAGGGSAISALRNKYGIDGRVAFMSYSAGFGFLDKISQNPADRAQISAELLVDSSFGGGKSGYVAYGQEAARGEHLLVASSSSSTGGEASWAPVWEQIASSTKVRTIEPRGNMPKPSGGVQQAGDLAFWYRYIDPELPHWEQHHVGTPMLESYLIPYWRGDLSKSTDWLGLFVWLGIAAAAGSAAARLLK